MNTVSHHPPSPWAVMLLAALSYTSVVAREFYAADADGAPIRLAAPAATHDEVPAHPPGPHPAIVVQQLHATAVATSDDAQPLAPQRQPRPGRLRTRAVESDESGRSRRVR